MDLNIEGKKLNTEHPDYKELEREFEELIEEFRLQYNQLADNYERPLTEESGRALAYDVRPYQRAFNRRLKEIRAKYEHLYTPEAHI